MVDLLSVKNISVFKEGRPLLNKVSFQITTGQHLAIMGETGSSKTTLLRSIAGLQELDGGEVCFYDQRVKGPSQQLVPGHAHIKYLPQNFQLPKFIKVKDYLDRPDETEVENPVEIYKACHIYHLMERDTMTLSGGERQRVALAKEVLKAPTILLLDEPFSNLDFKHRQTLHGVLQLLKNDLEVTVVLVAHDPSDVLAWSDRILVLEKGRVIQEGAPHELYNHPRNSYVAGLLGLFSVIPSEKIPKKTPGTKAKKEHIIRPDHVRIGPSGSYEGTVQAIRFYGTHDLLTLQMQDHLVYAHSITGTHQVGEQICFEIICP